MLATRPAVELPSAAAAESYSVASAVMSFRANHTDARVSYNSDEKMAPSSLRNRPRDVRVTNVGARKEGGV